MDGIKPMNDNLLIEIEDEQKNETEKVFYGENKAKPKTATILAFSDKCENKFEVGKKVYIKKYEMIPLDDSDKIFFVSEKAIIGMF